MKLTSLVTLLLALFLVSCRVQVHDKKEIESAIQTYDRLIKKLDADSIALMYTPDGDLGEIAHGRDSIRSLLSTFTNVKILSVASTSDSILLNKDTAVQKGKYNQVAVVDDKDTVRPKGSYEARWIWTKEDGWKIKRMTTTPD